jgi:hypothetical protein
MNGVFYAVLAEMFQAEQLGQEFGGRVVKECVKKRLSAIESQWTTK